MEVLTIIGIVLGSILAFIGVIILLAAFWDGWYDGWTDIPSARHYNSHTSFAETALGHPPVVWHGWYAGFYTRNAYLDWFDKNDIKERRNARRQKAVDRRENRRRKLIETRGV